MGRRIFDPEGVESTDPDTSGLDLLPVDTVFATVKETHRVRGLVTSNSGMLLRAEDAAVEGYEIHMGSSVLTGEASAPFRISRPGQLAADDGAMSANGRALGTYVHGLFNSHALRRALLEQLAEWKGVHLPPISETGGPAIPGCRVRQAGRDSSQQHRHGFALSPDRPGTPGSRLNRARNFAGCMPRFFRVPGRDALGKRLPDSSGDAIIRNTWFLLYVSGFGPLSCCGRHAICGQNGGRGRTMKSDFMVALKQLAAERHLPMETGARRH